VTLQQGAVRPLSQRGARHHQAEHVTAAAVMGAQRSAVPLNDGATGQGRQDDTLTRGARALHIDEHGQVIDGEVQHGSGLFELREV
jgi:hypothetical protein